MCWAYLQGPLQGRSMASLQTSVMSLPVPLIKSTCRQEITCLGRKATAVA